MRPDLLPANDITGIPGPAWLFQVLLVLTFVVHMVLVNLALGSLILAAVSRLRGSDAGRRAAGRLTGVSAFAISLAITTGVAPLLFLQVLYGPLFYTATILLAGAWFGLLGLLVAGYYAVYAFKMRAERAGAGWLILAAVLFVLIAAVQVAVNLVHSQPGGWAAIADHPWSVLADPMYWPRLLHFLLAAVAFAAAAAAWWAVRRARAGIEPEANRRIAAWSWRWALAAVALQVVDGVVLLAMLPRPALLGLMDGGFATLGPLGLAVLLAVALVVLLARGGDPVQQAGAVTGVLAVMTVVVAAMSITRHQLRLLLAGAALPALAQTEAPQWGNMALFAVLLVAGLAVVVVMVRRVLASPATGADAA